jgi:hypothetical protein
MGEGQLFWVLLKPSSYGAENSLHTNQTFIVEGNKRYLFCEPNETREKSNFVALKQAVHTHTHTHTTPL